MGVFRKSCWEDSTGGGPGRWSSCTKWRLWKGRASLEQLQHSHLQEESIWGNRRCGGGHTQEYSGDSNSECPPWGSDPRVQTVGSVSSNETTKIKVCISVAWMCVNNIQVWWLGCEFWTLLSLSRTRSVDVVSWARDWNHTEFIPVSSQLLPILTLGQISHILSLLCNIL